MSRIFRIFSNYFFYVLVCRLDKVKFLRSKGMRIGKGCQLVNALTDYGSEPYLIELENNITVAGGVFFLTHDAASRLFRDRVPGASKFGNRFGRILVRDNCFIGAGSIILPNVEIGPNSIVGAGSVVTKLVPPNSVVAGNPARIIRTLDEYIEKYTQEMITINASNRRQLRQELTMEFWNEQR